MGMIPFYDYNIFYPFIPPNCDKPPTLYSILVSPLDIDLISQYGKI